MLGRRTVPSLDKLCEFGMILNRLEQNKDALDLVVNYVSNISGAVEVALTLFDNETNRLEIKSSIGNFEDIINLFPTKSAILEKIAYEGNFIIDNNKKSVVSLPLYVANEIIGFLHVKTKSFKKKISKKELRILVLLSSQFAPSLGMLLKKEKLQTTYIEMSISSVEYRR